MRILIVTPLFPYPPTGGFVTRVLQFIRLLAKHNSVSVLTYAEPGDTDHLDKLKEFCDAVYTVPRASTKSARRSAQLASLISPSSFQWRSNYSTEMQQALNECVAKQTFDIVQLESSQMAAFQVPAPNRVILDEHDIVFELLYRLSETEHSTLRRVYNRAEFRKFKRAEVDAWHRVAGCLTTSDREKQIIHELSPSTPTAVVPNAVDVDYFHPSDEPVDDNIVVMTGLMKTRPNIDGAIYFVREILPHILAVRPNLVFYLVGGEPADEVKALAGPNVVVTGSVPDVRPYVYRAALFVVPLRIGSGTRLKVLEGLSMRKPMISTALGCEGIDVEDGKHIVIVDEPKAFATAVLDLLGNKQRAAELASNGHALVHQRYRWQTVVEAMEAFYRTLVPEPAAAKGK